MNASVCCIIFNPKRDRVLLIQRRDIPVWVLPGGGIDEGETPEKAAVREVEEETGLKGVIHRKIAEYTPTNRLSRYTYFFEIFPTEGVLSTGVETKDIGFFPLKALPKHLAPPYRFWIEDAVANHPAVLHTKIKGTSYWNLLKHLVLHPILVCRFLLTKIGIHLNSK